jgi:hypothetical protein
MSNRKGRKPGRESPPAGITAKRKREAAASRRHYWELRLVDVVDLARMFIGAHPERFGYLGAVMDAIDRLHAGTAACAACDGGFGGELPQGYGVFKKILAEEGDPVWSSPLCGSCAQRDDIVPLLAKLRRERLFERFDLVGADPGCGETLQ